MKRGAVINKGGYFTRKFAQVQEINQTFIAVLG